MKKKRIIRSFIIIIVLLILFCPMGCVKYRDGGTRDYRALTYRVVIWNRFIPKAATASTEVYHKTSIFLFPDTLKSIDELWELEKERSR